MCGDFDRHVEFCRIDRASEVQGVPENNMSDERKHNGMVILQYGNDPPGVLCKRHVIQATFKDDSDLFTFPFDSQRLRISLMLTGAAVPADVDHGRVLLPINAEMDLEYHKWVPTLLSTLLTCSLSPCSFNRACTLLICV